MPVKLLLAVPFSHVFVSFMTLESNFAQHFDGLAFSGEALESAPSSILGSDLCPILVSFFDPGRPGNR